ncbi:hypothetical protein ACHQM5_012859 [Ranunculus cassubicifolius]
MDSKGRTIERLRVLVKKYKEHALASKKRCDLRVMILHTKLKKLKMISATVVKEWEALKEEGNTLGRRISKMGLANSLKMIQLHINYRNEIGSSMTTCLAKSLVFVEMEIRLNGKIEEIKECQKDNEHCLFQIASIEETLKRWEDAATNE